MALWSIWGFFLIIALFCLKRKSFIFIVGIFVSALYGFWRVYLPTPEPIPPREIRATLSIERIFRSTNPEKMSGVARIKAAQGVHLKWLESQSAYFSLKKQNVVPAVLERGQKWQITGMLTNISSIFPSDKFDGFLWTNGVYYKISRVRTSRLCSETKPSLFFLCNRNCDRVLSSDVDDDATRIYKAMLLGRKEYLLPECFNDFMLTGTLHLFAVSGLHVGIIAGVVFGFLKFFPCSRPLRLLCSLAIVGNYVFVVGNSPSTVRAFFMIAMWVFAQLFYRQVRTENTLLASAFFVLLWNPKQLFDVGFQLSYGIVSAFIWFGVPLSAQLQIWLATPKYVPRSSLSWIQKGNFVLRRYFINAFSISLAATLLSQVFMAYYWQYITPWALVLNIFVIPLASIAVAFGACSLLIGSVFPWFPLIGLFNEIAFKCIRCLSFILNKAAMLPGASIPFKLSLSGIALFLGFFFIFTRACISGLFVSLRSKNTSQHESLHG